MATIYEMVDALTERVGSLETQMTTVNTQIAGMGATVLAENTDLNTLGVGKYIIPSAAVCATLLNRPDSSTATGFITVIEGGTAGQLIMYYNVCAKAGASYYERCFYEGSWGSWQDIDVYDSGWVDIELTGDVIAFNDEQKPRCRRVGKQVFLTGVVKNISAFDTVIATLPTIYRPSKKVIVAVPSTGVKYSRVSIQTNGVVTYEQSNDNTVAASNWHSIACSYNVD